VSGIDITVRLDWRAANLPDEVKAVVNEALKECGEDLLKESGDLVPLLTGILQGTGEVSEDEDSMTVNVSYDTPYAKRQHEDTRLRHMHPRQAKYLERALTKRRNAYITWIKDAIRNRFHS
jgi:hypothetical protein